MLYNERMCELIYRQGEGFEEGLVRIRCMEGYYSAPDIINEQIFLKLLFADMNK